MFERWTDRARKVMQLANQAAGRRGAESIDTLHVLIGLCDEGSGMGANVVRRLGLDAATIRAAATILLPMPAARDTRDEFDFGRLPRTDRANAVVERANSESAALGNNYVGTEHILLALLGDEVAGKLLADRGVTAAKVKAEIAAMAKPEAVRRWLGNITAPEPAQVIRSTEGILVDHLKAENDRLQAQLRAERHHNARLLVAFSHLREAAGRSHVALVKAYRDAEPGTEDEVFYDDLTHDIDTLINSADALILPLAE